MIEERVERLRNEIKSLKTTMPIAGSLVDTYCYTQSSSAVFPGNTRASYTMKFKPTFPENGLGLTEMFEYLEVYSSDPYWSQFNPIFLSVLNGYYKDANGNAVKDWGFTYGNNDDYTVKVTVAVYSTVPGDIEISFN